MEIGLEALRLYYNGQAWLQHQQTTSLGNASSVPRNRWPNPAGPPSSSRRRLLNATVPDYPYSTLRASSSSVSSSTITTTNSPGQNNSRLLFPGPAIPRQQQSPPALNYSTKFPFNFSPIPPVVHAPPPPLSNSSEESGFIYLSPYTDNWTDVPMIVNVQRVLLSGSSAAGNNSTGCGAVNCTDSELTYIHGEEYNFWALIAIVFILAGLVGNVLVCLAVTTDRRLQTPTNYFLLSLAVADLFVSVLVMPLGMSVELMSYWPFNFPTCLLYAFSDIFCCTASIMHMCMISIDRYMGISRPLTHRTRSVKFDIGMKILGVWLVSFAVSCPVIFVSVLYDKATVLSPDLVCALENKTIMIVGSVLAFFIPQLVMGVMMSRTLVLLRQQAKWSAGKRGQAYQVPRVPGKRPSMPGVTDGLLDQTKVAGKATRSDSQGTNIVAKRQSNGVTYNAAPAETGSNSESPDLDDDAGSSGSPARTPNAKNAGRIVAAINLLNRKNKQKKARQIDSEKKATTVLGLVFGIFCLCWTPFFIMNTASALCPDNCNISKNFFTFFLWLGWVSSTVNPMIYTVVNPNFRQAFIRLLSLGTLGKRCRGAVRVSVQNFRGIRPENPKALVVRRASKHPRPERGISWSPTFLTALELNNETPV